MRSIASTTWLTLFIVAVFEASYVPAQELKPRVVVLTDVSTWETDDSESLVRLFVHADSLEIEGLVFTTGWSLDRTRDDFLGLIHSTIDAYEKDLPNLRKRSDRQGRTEENLRQRIGEWPDAGYFRERTVQGSRKRGAVHIGEGNDSAGSRMIISLADEADDRPLWIAVWGGGNTLAQAVWRVQQERSDSELKKFLHKLRVYAITDQDRAQKSPFSESSHQWLRREFEKDLFFIWDECAWKYQNGTGRSNWSEYEQHIQTHGELGKVYPKFKYGVEGDTPSFLHLLPIGLNDPNEPTQGGWGGRFVFELSEDQTTSCFTNWNKPAYTVSEHLSQRFYSATFNNFAARMDWADRGTGNRNPIVIIDGDSTLNILRRTSQPGSLVTLDASGSLDPDHDELSFQWYVLDAAGNYSGNPRLDGADGSRATLEIPSDLGDQSIHLICEVTDGGIPRLTSYRRIIIAATER